MRVLVAALAATFLAGCQFLPSSGISRDRAIEIALRGGSSLEQPVVTLAREGRLADLRNSPAGELGADVDLNRMVWQVTLQGMATVCPPAGPGGPCQRFAATTQVCLDHGTGEFIFSETMRKPAPAQS